MKKFITILTLMLVTASLIFAQTTVTTPVTLKPKFVVESVDVLPGQEATFAIKVYNLPPMDISGFTFIVKPKIEVAYFTCSGIDVERWPFVVENYDPKFYAAAWVRWSQYSASQNSIQTYFDGEVIAYVQLKPIYNTEIDLNVEIANSSGNVIPIEIIQGKVSNGINPPPPPQSWKCGDDLTLSGKQYGTMWLPTQKVCMLTSNFDDGNSLKYNGESTGQYLAKDWVTPEGFYLPTIGAMKEANLPVMDRKGYMFVGKAGSQTLARTNNTYYATSGTSVNNWRVFWNPMFPTKQYTDSNYPTASWVRLCVYLK